ncbi:hypothetical protein WJX74_001032 [Apatococcus lobatus]|uniref:Uncharacterized protein n=1 Tax=Apatococcus lobatus TaxID=904363 RepID=A0AAW1SAT5_9CHLO
MLLLLGYVTLMSTAEQRSSSTSDDLDSVVLDDAYYKEMGMSQQDVEDQQALAADDIDPEADSFKLEDLFSPREGTPQEIIDAYYNKDVYGLEAVLMAGFRPEEVAMARVVLDTYGGEAVKVAPCSPAMLHGPVSAALEVIEPDWTQPAPEGWLSGSSWGTQRTILFSGLNPAAQSAVVELLEESGLPPICIATAEPDNADTILGEVLVAAVKAQRYRKLGSSSPEWQTRVTEELPNIEDLLKDQMPAILQDVEGGAASADAAFSAPAHNDLDVPPGTSLTLDELRSKVADTGSPGNSTASAHGDDQVPSLSPRSLGLSQEPHLQPSASPLRQPAAASASTGQASASQPAAAPKMPSEADLLADADSNIRLGNTGRVPLSSSGQEEPASGVVRDEAAHKAASKAFMDSIAGNVGAALEPQSDGGSTSSGADSDMGAPSSDSVISLDDIIADIHQQEAAEASSSFGATSNSGAAPGPPSSADQTGVEASVLSQQLQGDTASPVNPLSAIDAHPSRTDGGVGTPQADVGMSRESQASLASTAAAPASEEAIPGTSAGQSREFQAATDTNVIPSGDDSAPLETTAEGFQVVSRPQSSGLDQPDNVSLRTSNQGSSLLDNGESVSESSGAAAGPSLAGVLEAPSSSEDPRQSREAQANTYTSASTRSSVEAIPGTSAGQSREFQAGSVATPSSAANLGPESTSNVDGMAADALQNSNLDLSQNTEGQAAARSTTASPASKEAISELSAGQTMEVKASPPGTSRPQPKPFREPSPLPASFKLRPSPAGSSATPDTRASQAQGSRGNAGSQRSNGDISSASSSSSSSSRPMSDFAASIGKAPGSSPYERRRGSRRGATGPGPNGAGQYPSGKGFGNGSSSKSPSASASEADAAAGGQQPKVTSRRFGSNVWDSSQPDFVGFPDEDRVVRGGPDEPLPTIQSATAAAPSARTSGFQPDPVQRARPAKRPPRQTRERRRADGRESQGNPWAKTIKQQREREWLRNESSQPGPSQEVEQEPAKQASKEPLSEDKIRNEARGPVKELIAAAMACGLTAADLKTMVDQAVEDKARGVLVDPLAAMKAFGPDDDVSDPRAAERAAKQPSKTATTQLRRPGHDQPVEAKVMRGKAK